MLGGVMNRFLLSLLAVLVLTVQVGWTAESGPLKPSATDKCPVCGMFVAKYPDFVATIVFNDGSYAMFDGTKDMFKYYLDMKKYDRTKNQSDIKSIQVTAYYSLSAIDGYKALYVLGSDVYGPMGKELIPFEKEAEARQFMDDHRAKAMVKFAEITGEMIEKMD
jgi:copper chaperone NosL